MKIKIEISGWNLRNLVERIIAKEIVEICKKENDHDYALEDVVHWLDLVSVKQLISCWIRLVWPGTKRHLSQYPQWPRKSEKETKAINECEIVLDDSQNDKLSEEERYKWSFCPIAAKDSDGCVSMFAPGSDIIRFRNKKVARKALKAVEDLFDIV